MDDSQPERLASVRPVFVEAVPEKLERGVVYVSEKYGTAIHLCAGGCESQVVMPLQPDWSRGWTMQHDGDVVTFSPSILQNPCGHHYFIEANRVRWA